MARDKALGRMACLIRTYYRRRLGRHQSYIEDLVQESLLALHLRCSSYDSSLPITAWIFAIARHKLIDYWRQSLRHEALLQPLDEVPEFLLVDAEVHPVPEVDVRRLLLELTPAQRLAIELIKLDELSVAQAAARTGLSEVALRAQVHRGLKRLGQLAKPDS
ncbi:sigma-70 family RNA polymerase sigma factor [Pseudomonas sp. NFXW11]|uniref:sigma-70 family RNA polymerase sigma factor n=1 Tax=Pseudomonas sp. NFXW11 TaxID=2819531 RepID=UPI003CEC27D2